MQLSEYDRFGGVNVPGVGLPVFFSIPPETRQINPYIMFVDTEKLGRASFSVPHDFGTDPYNASDAARQPEDLMDIFWRFTKGPRRPIAMPHLSCDEGTLIFRGFNSNVNVSAFLLWNAEPFPTTLEPVPVKEMHQIQDTLGVKNDIHPIIKADGHLSTVQPVLTAFEQGLSPSALYQAQYKHTQNDAPARHAIIDGVKDFLSLTQLQLNFMLARYRTRIETGATQTQGAVQDFNETRRLLHQREVLGGWLAGNRPMDDLPAWNKNDMCDEKHAREFIESNGFIKQRKGLSHLHVAANNGSFSEAAAPVTRRTAPDLKIIAQKPAEAIAIPPAEVKIETEQPSQPPVNTSPDNTSTRPKTPFTVWVNPDFPQG